MSYVSSYVRLGITFCVPGSRLIVYWVKQSYYESIRAMWCLCAQWCLTVCYSLDYSLPDSSVHGVFPDKNTGAGCRFLFQGIFLTQGSNPYLLCLLHWQADSLPLRHRRSRNISNEKEKFKTVSVCMYVHPYIYGVLLRMRCVVVKTQRIRFT